MQRKIRHSPNLWEILCGKKTCKLTPAASGLINRNYYSFNKYLLTLYYIPDSLLGAENNRVNKADEIPLFIELTF